MKRTEVKEVEEYYCDFCGCECTDEHYDVTLPFKQTDGYTSRFAPENPDDNLIAIHGSFLKAGSDKSISTVCLTSTSRLHAFDKNVHA